MTELENVKEWFKNLVSDYREKINNLNKDEKKHIDFLSDLDSPLQINDFWFLSVITLIIFIIAYFLARSIDFT